MRSRLPARTETRRALETLLLLPHRSSSGSSGLTPYLIPSLFQKQQPWSQGTVLSRSASSSSASAAARPEPQAAAGPSQNNASESASAEAEAETKSKKSPPPLFSSTARSPHTSGSAVSNPQGESAAPGGAPRKSWTSLDQLLRSAANPQSLGGNNSGTAVLLRSRSSGRIETSRMLQPNRASPSPGEGGSSLTQAVAATGGGRAEGADAGKEWSFATLFPKIGITLPSNATATEAEMAGPKQKLCPALGRSVAVDQYKGMDVARAFRTVEVKCALNSVKGDVMRQRFHERPGLKRKRLQSQRWRARFKTAFQATVRRVEALQRQGW